MRAMLLDQPNQMSLRQLHDPKPEEGQVLIKMTHAGICGTDKIYQGKIPANYPLVMGHEIVGEIVSGDTTEEFKVGTRVPVDLVLYCGKCFHCCRGDTQLCPNGVIMGREVNGGFADYCVAGTTHTYKLPDEIDGKTGAAVQVLTTVLHAQDNGGVGEGDAVTVTGLWA